MTRLIKLFALILALLAGWTVPALAEVPAAAPAATTPARPALWKIADADTTIWLFGTIHALPAGVEWFEGPVAAAIKGADQLVTEIPETPQDQMKAAVLQNALLPEGKSLRALLAPATRAKFERALTKYGLPVEAFDRFEPWYAAVALTALPLAQSGYSPDNGVDERIGAEMKRLGRARIGLETAQDQFRMFAGLPMAVQKRYLAEVLDGIGTMNEELAAIVREWTAGSPERLAALLNADEDDPHMVKALLTDRNKTWAAWLQKRLAQPGTVFVAVGAGHLAGKDSVQDVLARAGLAVTRVQ
ncbi:TraB/GumN family protein [Novosphingobium bradum]|uniref:TraB/GumN family protein n=1 Tax=Novosphingobium bradum TaxID=1737444 RepID=A0ABV7IR43_9SPHN